MAESKWGKSFFNNTLFLYFIMKSTKIVFEIQFLL